ncbi:MerR family transcriptional regulator [Chloroflexota bacterium]
MKASANRPLYPIGVVSELLEVHPETVRTWERSGVVLPPQRRSNRRYYSENDLKRLRFIQRLAGEGLTLRAIHYYLRLYPCWQTEDCAGCMNASDQVISGKPCWQEESTYCQAAGSEQPCANCPSSDWQEQTEVKGTGPDTVRHRQQPLASRPAPGAKANLG